MISKTFNIIFIIAFLAAPNIFAATVQRKECDIHRCPGPLRYYEEINCKPVYNNTGDCCPVRYDCSHYDANMDLTKNCFVNGVMYKVEENIRSEDTFSCSWCTCEKPSIPESSENVELGHPKRLAQVLCATTSCSFPVSIQYGQEPPVCYSTEREKCCDSQRVCKQPKEIITCSVGSTTYKEGNYMNIPGIPEINCQCRPGYEDAVAVVMNSYGKDFPREYCSKPKCNLVKHSTRGINYNSLPPYYHENASSSFDCPIGFFNKVHNYQKAQKFEKIVGFNQRVASQEVNSCKWGSSRMNYGEQLKIIDNDLYDGKSCLICSCEVPPHPTCVRYADTTKCLK